MVWRWVKESWPINIIQRKDYNFESQPQQYYTDIFTAFYLSSFTLEKFSE